MGLILCRCGYNDFDPVRPEEREIPNPTCPIADLRPMYNGVPAEITASNIIISGRVTTSDRTNNFYRTFIVEDHTGAVEIRAGLYDMHNIYRVGQRVTILAEGLTLGMDNGLLQLGRRSIVSRYEVDYIDHPALLDKYVLTDNGIEPVPPAVVAIPELNDGMIGRLITIKELKLDCAADTTWALTAAMSPTGSP